jgi:hypothetical protein
MKLWIIQRKIVNEKFINGRLVHTELPHGNEEGFKNAYEFMVKAMIDKGLKKPDDANYPIWAWFRRDGERKKLTREEALRVYCNKTDVFQLTVDIPKDRVLLSNFKEFDNMLKYKYMCEPNWNENLFCGLETVKKVQATFWELFKSDIVECEEIKLH